MLEGLIDTKYMARFVPHISNFTLSQEMHEFLPNASQERYREGKRLKFERVSSGQCSVTIWEHKIP